MTPDQAQAIIRAAYAAACEAPKLGQAYAAKVPWSNVYRLRQALLDAGLGVQQGWKFPATHYGLGTGWRTADWEETAQYGEADAFGNKSYSHARCADCRADAVFIGPGGKFACDRHVPTKAPRP
jgi:hypothetical protein